MYAMEAPCLTPPLRNFIPKYIMAICLGLQRDYFDRLQACRTSITGEYYFSVIKQLRTTIKENQRGKLAAGVLQLHDNAPVYKCRVGQAAIRECKFKQLNHPPYSRGLNPSDYYYLFRNEVSLAWNKTTFISKDIDCFKEKWAKGIEVKVDYIEK